MPEGTPDTQCPHCLIGLGLAEAGNRQRAEAGRQKAEDCGQKPDSDLAADSTLRTPHSALQKEFGDYRLLKEIARGGMGVVYQARQVSLDRLVAVKMILAGELATPQFVQRFRTEAAAAAVLHHPNIVAIHEVGVHAGQHYFSMDFVDGPSLAVLVGHQPLPARRAAQYLKTIAEAIHYAHEQGILHRDLKPSNVLIDANDQPRITDFGLARRLEGETSLTLSGQMIGSPNFMPPEQATARHGKVGRYSDVYALGGILYHLLTARPPFQADSLEVVISQVLTAEPISPRLLNASVPRDLETICLKCLEKEPARRYASAQALADELGRFLENKPILARPTGPFGRTQRWCRRKPALATALGAVVLVTVVGFAGILLQWRRADQQRLNAESSGLLARQNAYAADMNLAQRALEANDERTAKRLLDNHRPDGKSATDLRGWEWRYLWQLCQADESVSLQTNSGSIGTVAISQDGRVMAVKTKGDKVAVWDLTTKRLTTKLPGSASIEILGLSPGGSLLAVGSRDARGEQTVEVWDVQARRIGNTLRQPSQPRSLAFSPDGQLLATFEHYGTNAAIAVVEWASNRTLTNFPVPPPRHAQAGVVLFSPNGSRLAVGEDYGRIRLLNWRTGTMVTMTNASHVGEGVLALAFSPTAELLAAGSGYASGTICFWDASSGELQARLTNHMASPRALTFTPDGRLLAAASNDRTIRIWKVSERVEFRCFRAYLKNVSALAFLPDSRTLAGGCDDGSLRFWDITSADSSHAHTSFRISHPFEAMAGQEVPRFPPEALDPRLVHRIGVSFAPDGRSFVATDPNGTLGLWNVRSVQLVGKLPELGSNHWGTAFSPDGRWLAAGEASGKINLWDWPARRLVTTFEFPFEWCGSLHFSRSGRFFWAVVLFNDWTTRFKMWRTGDWEEVPLPETQIGALWAADLSPDDRLLAMGCANGAVKLWRFPSGEHEATFTSHKGAVRTVLFSPEGRALASTGGDSQIKLWDALTRQELAAWSGHLGNVWSAAFSSDGRRLATTGTYAKQAVKVWDVATRRELLTLPAEGQYFMPPTFSPDGSTLATTSVDGLAHLWHAPSWKEIEAAEKGQVSP